MKAIYRAATEHQAAQELEEFVAKWGGKYQAIGKLWKENWERVTPFFDFPAEVRKMIYTPNGRRIVAYEPAENHQDPGSVSERRSGR